MLHTGRTEGKLKKVDRSGNIVFFSGTKSQVSDAVPVI